MFCCFPFKIHKDCRRIKGGTGTTQTYLHAKLLGVGELVHDSGYISDLNNLQVGHCSNVSTTLTQHIPPFEYTSDKIAICVGSTNDNKVQITGRNKEIWIRTMLYGEWGSWARIDNFECNTIADLITSLSSASNLSTLATALGEIQQIKWKSYHLIPNKYLEVIFRDGYYPALINVTGYQPNFAGIIQLNRLSGTTMQVLGKLIVGNNGNNKVFYSEDRIVLYTEVTNSQMDIVVNDIYGVTMSEYSSYDTSSMTELSW